MVNKPRKRGSRFRKYLRGNVDETITLATLASKVVAGLNFDETVNERTWASSIRGTWSLDQLTPATDVGPIMVGVAHSDYSAAEIEAFIENAGSWNEGDQVAQEVGKRKIRIVGIHQIADSASDADVLNDGKAITTKLGWILLQGQTLKQWAYNLGDAPVATTVPNSRVNGYVNLWPQ